MKFVLSSEDEGVKTTIEFHAECWPEVLEHFETFLRGSGYQLPPGYLDLVADDCDREIAEETQRLPRPKPRRKHK